MTPEIKHRIGQIRRGEMPEGYNRVRDSIIPSDWKQYCLGELGKNKNGLNFHREDKGIKIRIFGVGDFGNLSVLRDLNALSEISMRFMPDDELLLKNGDIVFVRSNGSKELVGRNLLVYPQNEKVSFSGFCIRFRLSSDKITTAEYINLLLDNGVLKQKLQSENQGSNISNLNQSIIDNLQISIPCKGEQQKIVAILTTQDRVIELKEKRLAEKQRQKKYLMQQLLTGKKRLPGFSGAWEKEKLGKCASMCSGGTPDTKNEKYYGNDYIWISIKDMTSAGKYICSSERGLTEAGLLNCSARLFPKGTILFAMYASIGECSIAETECCSSQAILGIEPDSKLNNEFLYYLLSNSKGYFKSFGQASSQPNLNKGIVQSIVVQIPEIEEQAAIAEVLSTADREIELLQQDIEQEKQKKKALMQLLLTGIVRVKT